MQSPNDHINIYKSQAQDHLGFWRGFSAHSLIEIPAYLSSVIETIELSPTHLSSYRRPCVGALISTELASAPVCITQSGGDCSIAASAVSYYYLGS